MTPARLLRLAAAAVLAAAAGTALAPAPATAATCASSSGVSVVVDFSSLGGGLAATCVADGGGDSAGALFEVDHDLTRIAQFPGAVCKVDGAPGDAQCQRMPPTDAYWGLFWSDGSGGWVYSSEGVDSLNVPDGGSVGFAWQDGGTREQPGVAPPQHATEQPSSSPTPDESDNGDGNDDDGGHQGSGPGPTGQPSAPSGASSTSPTPTSSPTAADDRETDDQEEARDRDQDDREDDRKDDRDQDGPGHAATSAATPQDDPSDAVPASADPPADDEAGLPVWVAPVAAGGLFGVAGLVALLRRRSAA